MTFQVAVLPQAMADIHRNAEWWAEHHSLEQAISWSELVYDQLESLSQFPVSHGLSRENDEFPYEIRDKLIGTGSRPAYRAVFTISGDKVYVLTVRRCAQDALRPEQVATFPED